MPNGLELQHEVMLADKACGILGSKVNLFGLHTGVWHFRQTSEQTKALALLGNTCLCHPSWMMRRKATGHLRYSTEFPHMEDMYFLAEYISQPNSKLYAVGEVLIDYRVHAKSISSLQVVEQLKQRAKILARTWEQQGIKYQDIDPLNFVSSFFAPKDNKIQVDNTLKADLISRIVPQLVNINHNVADELSRRLKVL